MMKRAFAAIALLLAMLQSSGIAVFAQNLGKGKKLLAIPGNYFGDRGRS